MQGRTVVARFEFVNVAPTGGGICERCNGKQFNVYASCIWKTGKMRASKNQWIPVRCPPCCRRWMLSLCCDNVSQSCRQVYPIANPYHIRLQPMSSAKLSAMSVPMLVSDHVMMVSSVGWGKASGGIACGSATCSPVVDVVLGDAVQ